MQWYYSADGAAVGPHSEDDIEDLFATGEVAGDTLVWRKGFAEWTPLADTDEFAQLADAGLPPPLPRAQRKAADYGADDDVLGAERLADDGRAGRQDGDTRVTTSHFTAATAAPVLAGPWTRYFARSIDMIIIISALSVGVYGVLPAVNPRYFSSIHLANPTAILIWLFPSAFLTNAIIITLFGNSLGKAIFAIRAEPNDPDRYFGWGGNIVREFRVWFQGMALYIPLLNFFTMIPAFRRVLRGAPTAYDLGRVSVRAYSQSRLRRTLGILFALLLYVGVAALAAVERSGMFSGSPAPSDPAFVSQSSPALSSPGGIARPTSWSNPATHISTTIPGGWSYEAFAGPDGGTLYGFTQVETGLVAILAAESLPNLGIKDYLPALAKGVSATIGLGDWSMSNLPGVWTAHGQTTPAGYPATVHAAQAGTQFWRIVYIDQLSTTPRVIVEPEMTAALFRSVGLGAR
ncbi:RDD family protein [Devosia sp. A16]|uniref:RDD family protein n=1 Tax=Devosia sp. A16 TaxID=1736675 RepID=UPI0006D76307|nr:RDD family protein [Devosia sp. A16]